MAIVMCAVPASADIVADSVSRTPLAGASVFNREGRLTAICGSDGRLPDISRADYPITLRCLGYDDLTVAAPGADTLYMHENKTELAEVVVESRQQKMLHILAYVREYSTLSTYTDTVFMFREKMVDFMLPTEAKTRLKGWRRPRILTSQSYYRFTDAYGLDSVSDRCNNFFSWSDWMGILPSAPLPESFRRGACTTDTVRGKYSPTEIWTRLDDRITLDVNVPADTLSRRWVPDIAPFFHDEDNIDFEQLRVRFNYDNNDGDSLRAVDLRGYSFNIESTGRGRGMFKFNRADQSIYVSTYAEVYIADKEYITVKEAKKWQRLQADTGDMAIFVPDEAPALHGAVSRLIERVEAVNHDVTRRAIAPDRRLAGRNGDRPGIGRQVLKRLKGMLGLDGAAAQRKWNKQWREFRKERIDRNSRTD